MLHRVTTCVNLILPLVIDAYVRVSVIGIEIVVIDARIMVASVDTYLRFAEAVNRMDLSQNKDSTTFPELMGGKSGELGEGKNKQAANGGAGTAKERTKERVGPG